MDSPSLSQQRVTDLLTRWSQGDDAALAELTPMVYEELRRLAHHYMKRERPDHTLQTTALVNEAYLRLADQTNPQWQNRVLDRQFTGVERFYGAVHIDEGEGDVQTSDCAVAIWSSSSTTI
jgi:hypothetical protein